MAGISATTGNFTTASWAGLELDADAADLKASGSVSMTSLDSVTGGGTITVQDEVKALATARGRVGWLAWNQFLLYGTGGLAWERIENTATLTGPLGMGSSGSGSLTNFTPTDRFGFVAEVGGEMAVFSNHWLLRVEYLHYELGKSAGNSYNAGSLGSLVRRMAMTPLMSCAAV